MPIEAATSGRSRLPQFAGAGLVIAASLAGGCGWMHQTFQHPGPHDTRHSYHETVGLTIQYPDVEKCLTEVTEAAREALPPLIDEDPSSLPSLELTLPEAVQLAVRQSPVIRELGGSIIAAPGFIGFSSTIYDPALAHANPLGGVEAALSAFDAQYSTAMFWNKLDRPNNITGFVEQFTPFVFQGTTGTYQSELSKRTAQGGQFSLRHITVYERNNSPAREFPSDFTGWVEAEWRQPLMRGAGTQFNRIVGTSQIPGQYNGVLIARVNEDVALADFEAAVIRLVNDVEQAYWELSAAYRVLEATLRGRESALQTFQYQEVRLRVGAGRSDEEAQAQSQFYQFQAQVESALSGPLGLYSQEQRLRYLLGFPAADGRLIKPTTEPSDARVVFDWESSLSQALQRRVEVRRQQFALKRRELELYAAQLNRRPQLDFLGNYRVRGLGDNLIGGRGGAPLDNLTSEIIGGNYQEWQAGMELTLPVGLRAASNAVTHARLSLQRERALLNETQLRISHDLAESVRQIGLTHSLLETNYNGLKADLRQVDVLRRRYRDGTDNINFLLQAQRQVVISEVEFYRSLSNYNLAIRDLHREKGSLLAYNGVSLAEGPWAPQAYQDAYEKGRFLEVRQHPESVQQPPPVTVGPFDPSAPQNSQPAWVPETGEWSAPAPGLDSPSDIPSPTASDSPAVPPKSANPSGPAGVEQAAKWQPTGTRKAGIWPASLRLPAGQSAPGQPEQPVAGPTAFGVATPASPAG